MSIDEFKNYAKNNLKLDLNDYVIQISELSKSDNVKCPLIDSDVEIYNFDGIVKSFFNGNPSPASVDGLYFSKSKNGNTLVLIEFKTGFNQRITKETFDINKCECPNTDRTNQVNCKDYGKILLENQNLKFAELLDSLKLKMVESYLMLKKMFFRPENVSIKKNPIKMIVVIDVNVLETEEKALADLAAKTPNDNKIQAVKNALSRFSSDKYNLYQEINVFSAIDFEKMCKEINFII